MATALIPVITEAGLAAVFNQSATGLAAEITHIAVGDRAYTPTQEQTSLRHEVARFPIADGKMATPTQAHMTALDDTQREYWVREVGFFLSDGTLFAVLSNPTQPYAYKTAGNDFLHAYDLLLTAVPAGSVIVNSTGARMSLYFAEEFAQIGATALDNLLTNFLQTEQINALNAQRTILAERLKRTEQSIVAQDLRDDEQTAAIATIAASVMALQNQSSITGV